MTHVGVHAAKTQLSKLVKRAEAGEEIVITRHGEPAVCLVPARTGDDFKSLAGARRGRVKIADDFDEPPADLAGSLGENS